MAVYTKILIDLIQERACKKVAEIGIWRGVNARNILRTCHDSLEFYWAIDPWAILDIRHLHMSKLTQAQWDAMYHRCCLDMFYFPKLHVLRMTSELASKLFPKNYFDLVFIDGCHFHRDVLQDISFWKPLVKQGGILSGHDYDRGRKKGHNVKKAVDDALPGAVIKPDSVWLFEIPQ